MKVDLENMLRLAGNAARRGEKVAGGMYAYSLEELGRNLRELRDRHAAGDVAVVAEFFALYILHDRPAPAKVAG